MDEPVTTDIDRIAQLEERVTALEGYLSAVVTVMANAHAEAEAQAEQATASLANFQRAVRWRRVCWSPDRN
jgi:hypothetical protein